MGRRSQEMVNLRWIGLLTKILLVKLLRPCAPVSGALFWAVSSGESSGPVAVLRDRVQLPDCPPLVAKTKNR